MTTFKALQKLAPVLLATFAVIGVTASPALARIPPENKKIRHWHSPNPNGIAVDESTGDVYVADIGTGHGVQVRRERQPGRLRRAGGSQRADRRRARRPGRSRSRTVYGTPAAIAVDNACVQHTPVLTGKACEEFDPSAGDLYVMDAGHGVIDKFSPEGSYLSQIGGFPPSTGSTGGELLGLGVDGSGTVHVDLKRVAGNAAGRGVRRRGRESSHRSPGNGIMELRSR